MATDPIYAATPGTGSAVLSASADTTYTAPTHAVTIYTAGASGSKIEEVRFVGTGTTLAGMINLFVFDATTYHLIDQVLVGAVTSATTSANWQTSRTYLNLWLKTSWTLVATSTVASQLVCVTAFGGDF